jgi:hypothetical protein
MDRVYKIKAIYLSWFEGAEDFWEEFTIINPASDVTVHRDRIINYYEGILERGNKLSKAENAFLNEVANNPDIEYWLVDWD